MIPRMSQTLVGGTKRFVSTSTGRSMSMIMICRRNKLPTSVSSSAYPWCSSSQSSWILVGMPSDYFRSSIADESVRNSNRPWMINSRHVHSYRGHSFPCNQFPIFDALSSTTSAHQRWFSSAASKTRAKDINNTNDDNDVVDEDKMSNRAAFRATPIIPSILSHIEKIGVGIRSKPKYKKRNNRRFAATTSNKQSKQRHYDADTLDEAEEFDYFNENERRHRTSWEDKRREKQERSDATGRRGDSGKNKANKKHHPRDNEYGNKGSTSDEPTGAYWLPPPPFSTFTKQGTTHHHHGGGDTLDGRRIVRQPVKLIGQAGSLNDTLPRATKGLSEVAIAGRSNVGKSTLLNALLYGNIDETLSPRKFQRGKVSEGAKLPKGVKAITSSKPGETKQLSFYQLTADVGMEPRQATSDDDDDDDIIGLNDNKDEDGHNKKQQEGTGKMSLLMVDLPGYGFAYAKAERTQEWKDLMHHYLLERNSLKRILFLLDARHGFKKADFDFLEELQDGLMAKVVDGEKKAKKRDLPPIQIILTKCDLVKQADLARRVVVVRQQLSDFLIREPSSLPVMLVSARAGLGFNNIRGETPLGGVLELQRELASLVPVPRFR